MTLPDPIPDLGNLLIKNMVSTLNDNGKKQALLVLQSMANYTSAIEHAIKRSMVRAAE